MAYDFRALVDCQTSQNRKGACADLDRAIKLEPNWFLSYGLRAFVDVKIKDYARAVTDPTMRGLTLNQCDFGVYLYMNTYRY
jgi:hypothetical protein